MHFHTNASSDGHTALSKRSFQGHLDPKSRTVHRQNVCGRRPELVREEVDGGLDAVGELSSAEVQAADDLRRPVVSYIEKTLGKSLTMWIGLLNLLTASVATLTMPACEQLNPV